MKKIILLAGLLFAGAAQAQTITAKGNNTPISNGQTFTFATLEEDEATLNIEATNISNESIYLKLRVNSITNADGSDVQFCFGNLCFFNVSQGSTVPNNGNLVAIAPGATTGPTSPGELADHFFNENPGTVVGQDVIYNLSFIKVTSAGVFQEELLSFNYKYSPTAGINDFTSLKNMGITLGSTVVKNTLDIISNNNAVIELYNINGQLVKTAAIISGPQAVDVSSLSAAVYIASFTTQDNRTSKIRIVKN